MLVIYNFLIYLYHSLVFVAALFNRKARLYIEGRKIWQTRLMQKTGTGGRYIWFHCASLGEFEQGRPLIEAIHIQFPQYKIALTFFSPSGYEIRKDYPLADIIAYLPADTRDNATDFIRIVKPEMAIFVKYEFWYHYTTELRKNDIPLYLVSGIFRKNQVFFKKGPLGKWFRKILGNFTWFFVQDENSVRLLASLGIEKCTISGDTRFDRVAEIAKSSKPVPVVEKFSDGKIVLVAGSTWKPDEDLITRWINENEGLHFIIAPHEVNSLNIKRLEKQLKKPSIRFSQANDSNIARYSVLIIDSVGLLSSLYRYGKIAYIGGGFGVGIHNILEAATFGLPVIFGPNYKKFREARDLVSSNAAFPVESYDDFVDILNQLTCDTKKFEQCSQKARNYVNNNLGATRIIVGNIIQ
jgi:3-deoxy-D-manno-octulosonic-acid transferase